MAHKGLDAVTATAQGSWFSINNTKKLTVHVYGATATGFSATVEIRGSNRPTKPADSFDDVLIATVTAASFTVVDAPMRWMKHSVTAHTAGVISSHIRGGYSG